MEVYKLVSTIEERDSRPVSRSPSTQSTPQRRRFEAPNAAHTTTSRSSSASAAQQGAANTSTSPSAAKKASAEGSSPSSLAGIVARPLIASSVNVSATKAPVTTGKQSTTVARTLNMSDESVHINTSAHFARNNSNGFVRREELSGAAVVNFSDPSLYLNASVEEKEAAMRYAEDLVRLYTSSSAAPTVSAASTATATKPPAAASLADEDSADRTAQNCQLHLSHHAANNTSYYAADSASHSVNTSIVSISNKIPAAPPVTMFGGGGGGIRNSPQKGNSYLHHSSHGANSHNASTYDGVNESMLTGAGESSSVVPFKVSAMMGHAATTLGSVTTSPSSVFVSPEVNHLRQLLQGKLENGIRAAFDAFTAHVPNDPILRQLLEEDFKQKQPNVRLAAAPSSRAENASLPLPPASVGVPSSVNSPPSSSSSLIVHKETAWRRVGETVAEHMHSALAAGYDALASELAVARGEIARQALAMEDVIDAHNRKVAGLEIELKNALEMNVLLMEEASQANVLRRQIEEELTQQFFTRQQQINRLVDGETSSRWFCVAEESKAFIRLLSEHNSLRGAILDVEVREDLQKQFHSRLEFLKAMQEQWRSGEEGEESTEGSSEERDVIATGTSASAKPPKAPIRGLAAVSHGADDSVLSEESDDAFNFVPRPPPGLSPRREARELEMLREREQVMQTEAILFAESNGRLLIENEALFTNFQLVRSFNVETSSALLLLVASLQNSNHTALSPMTYDDRSVTSSTPSKSEAEKHLNDAERRLDLFDDQKAELQVEELQALELSNTEALSALISLEESSRATLERAILIDCLASFALKGVSALVDSTVEAVRDSEQSKIQLASKQLQIELRQEFFAKQKDSIDSLEVYWTAELEAMQSAANFAAIVAMLEAEEAGRRRLVMIADDSFESLFNAVTALMATTARQTLAIDELKALHREELHQTIKHLEMQSAVERQRAVDRTITDQRAFVTSIFDKESHIRNDLLTHFATQRIGILAEFFEGAAAIQTQQATAEATTELTQVLLRQFAAERAVEAEEAAITLQQREELLEEKHQLQTHALKDLWEAEKQEAVAAAVAETSDSVFAAATTQFSATTFGFIESIMNTFAAHRDATSRALLDTSASLQTRALLDAEIKHGSEMAELSAQHALAVVAAVTDARRDVEDKYKALHDETVSKLAESYEYRITAQREELYAELALVRDIANGSKRRGGGGGEADDFSKTRSASNTSSPPTSAAPSLMQTPVKVRNERVSAALALQRESLELLQHSSAASMTHGALAVLKAICDQHSLAVNVEFHKSQLAIQSEFIVLDRASREYYEEELIEALRAAEDREESAQNALARLSDEYALLQEKHRELTASEASALDSQFKAEEAFDSEIKTAVQTIEALRSEYEETVDALNRLKSEHHSDMLASLIASECSLRSLIVANEVSEWAVFVDIQQEFSAALTASLRRFETDRINQRAEETDKLVSAVVTNIVDSNINLTNVLKDHRSSDEAVVRATVDDSVFSALTVAFCGRPDVSDTLTSEAEKVDYICTSLAGRIADQLNRRIKAFDSNPTNATASPCAAPSASSAQVHTLASHNALLTKLERLEQMLEDKVLSKVNHQETSADEMNSVSNLVDVNERQIIPLEAQIATLQSELAITTMSLESSLAILGSLLAVLEDTSNDKVDEGDSAATDSSDHDEAKPHARLFQTTQRLFRVLHGEGGIFNFNALLSPRGHSSTTTKDDATENNQQRHLSAVLEGQLVGAKAEISRLRTLMATLKDSTNKQLDIIATSTHEQIQTEMASFNAKWEHRLDNDIASLTALAKQMTLSNGPTIVAPQVLETVFGETARDILVELHSRMSHSARIDSEAFEEEIERLKKDLAVEKNNATELVAEFSKKANAQSGEANTAITDLKTELAVAEERVAFLTASLADANGRYETLFAESTAERNALSSRVDTLMVEKQVDSAKIALLETDLKHVKASTEMSAFEREQYWREKVNAVSELLVAEKHTVQQLQDMLDLAQKHESNLEKANGALKADVEALHTHISDIEAQFETEKKRAIDTLIENHEKDLFTTRQLWEEKVKRLAERVEEITTNSKSISAETVSERASHAAALSAARSEHQSEVRSLKESHEVIMQSTVQQLTSEHEGRIADLKAQLASVTAKGDEAVADLKSQLGKVTLELETVRNALSALSEEHSVLKEGPMMRLKIGEESLTRQVSDLKEALSEMKTRLEQKESEISRLRDLINDAERQLASTEGQLIESNTRLESAIRERDAAIEQLERSEKQLGSVSDEMSQLKRQCHELEMDLTENKSLLQSAQTSVNIANSEKQEIYAAKIELERQLFEIQSGKHSDLSALQLKISSLTRRIMDEERRNGDLHRRCVEKDASLKRFTNVSMSSVAAVASNTAIITESRQQLTKLMETYSPLQTSSANVSIGNVQYNPANACDANPQMPISSSLAAGEGNSPSPIPLTDLARQTTAVTIPFTSASVSREMAGAKSVVSPTPTNHHSGKFSSIAREIQMERMKSSVARSSSASLTSSPLLTMASATLREPATRDRAPSSSNPRPLLAIIESNLGSVVVPNNSAENSHSPDAQAQLYLRYSASPESTKANGSKARVSTSPSVANAADYRFTDLQQLAINGRAAQFGNSGKLTVPGAIVAGKLLQPSSSPSLQSTNGPSISPTLTE